MGEQKKETGQEERTDEELGLSFDLTSQPVVEGADRETEVSSSKFVFDQC